MKFKTCLLLLLAMALCLSSSWALAGSVAKDDPIMLKAGKAVEAALAEVGGAKGQAGLLFLTNAGYGQIKGNSTEAFLDVASQASGLSMGAKNLLMVHSSCEAPMWFSLYNQASNKLVFAKCKDGGFNSQTVDADPKKILTPEGWKAAAKVMGPVTFGVVSISLTWAEGVDWPLLWSAHFHNHFCPGLNAGYLAAEYLRRNLPLGPGDKYVFVGAPAKCFNDALQVIFDATLGKSGSFGMPLSGKTVAKYLGDKLGGLVIAMRVNPKSNTCQGLVLGLDWKKAYVDTGVPGSEMAPEGGPSNPLFWISRVKMSASIAAMPMDKKLAYVVKVKEFSGPAKLANQVAVGGGDPYAVVWKK